MAWLDRRAAVLLSAVVALHIAILVVNVWIIHARLATDWEGMGGLAYVGIAMVAIFVVAPLVSVAALGIVVPLVAFDLLGAWWALRVPNAGEYGDLGRWHLMAALFCAAAAAGVWLQVMRLQRRQRQINDRSGLPQS